MPSLAEAQSSLREIGVQIQKHNALLAKTVDEMNEAITRLQELEQQGAEPDKTVGSVRVSVGGIRGVRAGARLSATVAMDPDTCLPEDADAAVSMPAREVAEAWPEVWHAFGPLLERECQVVVTVADEAGESVGRVTVAVQTALLPLGADGEYSEWHSLPLPAALVPAPGDVSEEGAGAAADDEDDVIEVGEDGVVDVDDLDGDVPDSPEFQVHVRATVELSERETISQQLVKLSKQKTMTKASLDKLRGTQAILQAAIQNAVQQAGGSDALTRSAGPAGGAAGGAGPAGGAAPAPAIAAAPAGFLGTVSQWWGTATKLLQSKEVGLAKNVVMFGAAVTMFHLNGEALMV